MECFPETPEGVALALFWTLLAIAKPPAGAPREAWMLDLFAMCLEAASGKRGVAERPPH